nr:EpsG family protein [Vibrio cholerae]
MLSIFVGLRFETGTDYNEYLNIWMYSPSILSGDFFSSYSHIEFGFKLLIEICRAFGGNDRTYFFINSIITFGFLYFGLIRINKKYKFNLLISVLLYFCTFIIPYSMNAMRQAIVMSMFIFALRDIFDKNHTRVMFLTMFATAIHSTGAFIFISYLLYCVTLSYLNVFIFSIATSIVLYFYNPLVLIVNIIFPGKFNLYMTTWGGGEVYNAFMRLILYILISSMYFYSRSSQGDEDNKNITFLMVLYSVGVVLYFAFFDASMVATRLNMFFRITEVFLIPFFISKFSLSNRMFLIFAFMLLFVPYLYSAAMNPQNEYKSYLGVSVF